MIPLIEADVVEKRKWTTEEELLDYYAVGQCTPGIIAVNTATFVGQKIKGFWGAVFATAGVVFPSLVIISIIAGFIQNFSHLEWVQHAFAGIRVAVAVLVVNAVLKLWKSGIKDILGIIIFIVTFVVSAVFSLSPVFVVIAAILVGILAGQVKRRTKK